MADASNLAADISTSASDEHRRPDRRVHACVSCVDSWWEARLARVRNPAADDGRSAAGDGVRLTPCGWATMDPGRGIHRYVAVNRRVRIGFIFGARPSRLVVCEC